MGTMYNNNGGNGNCHGFYGHICQLFVELLTWMSLEWNEHRGRSPRHHRQLTRLLAFLPLLLPLAVTGSSSLLPSTHPAASLILFNSQPVEKLLARSYSAPVWMRLLRNATANYEQDAKVGQAKIKCLMRGPNEQLLQLKLCRFQFKRYNKIFIVLLQGKRTRMLFFAHFCSVMKLILWH